MDVKLQQIGYLPNKKWLLCAVVYQISQFRFKFLVMTEKKIFVIKYFSFYFIFLVKIAIPLKLKLSIKKGFCSFFGKLYETRSLDAVLVLSFRLNLKSNFNTYSSDIDCRGFGGSIVR